MDLVTRRWTLPIVHKIIRIELCLLNDGTRIIKADDVEMIRNQSVLGLDSEDVFSLEGVKIKVVSNYAGNDLLHFLKIQAPGQIEASTFREYNAWHNARYDKFILKINNATRTIVNDKTQAKVFKTGTEAKETRNFTHNGVDIKFVYQNNISFLIKIRHGLPARLFKIVSGVRVNTPIELYTNNSSGVYRTRLN